VRLRKGDVMVTIGLKALIDLVEVDQQSNMLLDTVRSQENEFKDVEMVLQSLENALELFKSDVTHARKIVDEYELSVKELQVQEHEKKERLAQVSNKKEYGALKIEIEHILEKHQEIEPKLLSAWNKFEQLQKNYLAKMEEVKARKQELLLKREQIAKNTQKFKQEYTDKISLRGQFLQEVPVEWLGKYNLMRERVKNPVVKIFEKNCGACFYAIPPKDLALLRAGSIIQCKDCYRLLYAS